MDGGSSREPGGLFDSLNGLPAHTYLYCAHARSHLHASLPRTCQIFALGLPASFKTSHGEQPSLKKKTTKKEPNDCAATVKRDYLLRVGEQSTDILRHISNRSSYKSSLAGFRSTTQFRCLKFP